MVGGVGAPLTWMLCAKSDGGFGMDLSLYSSIVRGRTRGPVFAKKAEAFSW